MHVLAGTRHRTSVAVLAAGLLLASCSGAPPDAAPTPTAEVAPPAADEVVFTPPPRPPPAPVTVDCPPPPPAVETPDPRSLTRTEKAALILVTGLPGVQDASDPEALAVIDIGVGGVVLRGENIRSAERTRALIDGLATRSRYGVLAFVDHEGGRVAHAKAAIAATPSARRLGGAGADHAHTAGAAIGTGLRALGVHANLAPVADLDDGHHRGVIGDRAFGGTPEVVGATAAAFLAGLHQRGTLGVAKHFPGYAGAPDTHHRPAIAEVSPRDLRRDHLAPFQTLIADGVQAVMLGHVTYPAFGDLPASLNPRIYQLLRDQGFDGVAVTDSLGMGAVYRGRGHGRAAVEALAAGADVLLANQGSEAALEMRDAIVAAVASGEVAEQRLDEAVHRTLVFRVHQWHVAAGCR